MRFSVGQSVTILGAIGSLVAAAPAYAGCGDNALLKSASWQGDASGLLKLANYDFDDDSIVGMWSVQFLAGGATIDFGYQQWHSDGTEIMNSGGRAPATGNFCLGVWKQTGRSTYKLNHFALSYDPATGKINAKVNIKEDVIVDQRGDNFSGPFTFDVYDPNSGALLQHIAGRVVGKRVTVNSNP